MATFKYFSSVLCFLICSSCTLLASEFRIFTDKEGRKMEAKITRASGSNVYIEKRDGLSTHVDISIFIEEDQNYIEEWALDKLIEDGLFDVRFSRQLTDKKEYISDEIIYNEYNMHFEIIISNNSHNRDFKDLKVDYLILKFEDKLSTTIRSWGNTLRIKGSTGANVIKAREEVRISTDKFPMMETRVTQDSLDINGRSGSKDDIRGIWVKIYIGDKLAYEIAKPGNIMQKEPWDEESQEED